MKEVITFTRIIKHKFLKVLRKLRFKFRRELNFSFISNMVINVIHFQTLS